MTILLGSLLVAAAALCRVISRVFVGLIVFFFFDMPHTRWCNYFASAKVPLGPGLHRGHSIIPTY